RVASVDLSLTAGDSYRPWRLFQQRTGNRRPSGGKMPGGISHGLPRQSIQKGPQVNSQANNDSRHFFLRCDFSSGRVALADRAAGGVSHTPRVAVAGDLGYG